MRVLVTLAAALAAAVTLATASPLASMSESELAAATAELLAWKASPAGLEAQRRGFAAPPSATTTTTADELARFVTAKATVATLQQQQPHAVFSLDTPLALLTFDEFLAKTGSTAEPPAPTTTATTTTTTDVTAVNASSTAATAASARTSATRSRVESAASLLADAVDVDWQRAGCVTRVQHEGACNAGWAFAAVASIETGYCARSASRRLYELSEQDILTCSAHTRCDYGITPDAFAYVVHANGGSLCTEASLPYTRADYEPSACARVDDPAVACDKPDLQVASYVVQNYRDHRDLEAVVRERAVTAMIYLCPLMQYYVGGIVRGDQTNCPAPTSWNSFSSHHDVLIVGFGTRDGIPYWKVKNSVGLYWGEQGYGYIERGYQGHAYGAAGIEQWNAYPLFQWELAPSFAGTRVTGPRFNVEILGDDLKTVSLMQFAPEQCGDICRREPQCKAYFFYKDNGTPVCRLKASVTGERRTLSIADWTASGAIVAKEEMANGLCLAREVNVDYPGNDLFHALAASSAECCDMCFSSSSCNAYTWTQYHGGSCFLKSARAADPQARAPAPDGSAYFQSGVAYKCQPLQFGTDFPGGDFASAPAQGPMDCCAHCRLYNGFCAGYTWTDYNGGTCWLKSSVAAGAGVSAPGVFAAFA